MEGIALRPGSPLAEFAAEHGEISFCRVEGNCYAWTPAPGDEFAGELAHGRDEDELLAKLAGGT